MGDTWINFGYTDCLLSPYQPPDEPIITALLGINLSGFCFTVALFIILL